jgi:hypothetical protein
MKDVPRVRTVLQLPPEPIATSGARIRRGQPDDLGALVPACLADTIGKGVFFCAACGAVNFDAIAANEQPVRRVLGPGERAEDVLPDAVFSPAREPVVQRLLGRIERRAIAPAPPASCRVCRSARTALPPP